MFWSEVKQLYVAVMEDRKKVKARWRKAVPEEPIQRLHDIAPIPAHFSSTLLHKMAYREGELGDAAAKVLEAQGILVKTTMELGGRAMTSRQFVLRNSSVPSHQRCGSANHLRRAGQRLHYDPHKHHWAV